MDNIDFLGQNDRILGGGIYKNVPIFFSIASGFVSILPSESARFELSNM